MSRKPEPRRLGGKLSRFPQLPYLPHWLLAGVGLTATQAIANPCTGKNWVDAPVIEFSLAAAPRGDSSGLAEIRVAGQDKSRPASHLATGIGGTGHSQEESGFAVAGGIGGTGHSGAGETPPQASGIGGTGHNRDKPMPALADADAGGIGGTGHSHDSPMPALADAGGIGGTGHSRDSEAATGFVGVIAGFASICVNGAEIHFDASTSVGIDGVANPSSALALGQAVSVTAVTRGDLLYAQNIAVLHAVVGPVQRVDAATGQLEVLGQTLRLGNGLAALRDIRVGDTLAVDGHRLPGGDIRVTRLEKMASAQRPSVMGTATAIDGASLRINGLPIRLPEALAVRPQTGQDILVTGSLVDGVLNAERIIVNPTAAFTTPVRRLDTQGYVRTVDRSGTLNVDGASIDIDRNTQIVETAGPIAAGTRIHVVASVNADGRAVAERIRVERPAERDRAVPGVSRRGVDGQSERGEDRQARGDGAVERRPDRSGANPDERARIDSLPASAERPGGGMPDIARPELARPEFARPEFARPDARPQIERPERSAPIRN